MRGLLITLLLTLTPALHAEIYKWVEPDGTVVYSDQPREGAQTLDLPEAQTFTPPPVGDGASGEGQGQGEDSGGYQQLGFASPGNEATIRNTGGVVQVSLAIEPPLDIESNHRVAVVMDDTREFGPTRNAQFSLKDVPRGTHTLQAMIHDGQGNVVKKSDRITIFVKQASRLNPPPSRLPRRTP